MRDKIEQIKQAVAAGQMPRAQGADMIGRIVQAEDPELFAGLSVQNAQNKMQQAAASQAGGDGMSFVGGSRPKGPPPRQPTPEEQMTRQQYEEQMRSQGGGSANINMQKPTGLITGDVPHHDQPYVPPKEDYSILPRIVPERPTFGSTMKYMGGGLMDAGRSIGGGLSSMGKSLSAGTKSLFNDPSRMALLQGGLSMMDPNTYYDKQGFGSVFTGMNTGLGAAQQGYKNVLDRRETEADTFLKKSGRGGKLPASYLQVLNRWENES